MYLEKIKKFLRSLPINIRKSKVNFVYDSDLDTLLQNLEVGDNIVKEKFRCLVCDETITKDNLGAIIKKDSKIKFLCNKPMCLINYDVII